VIRQAVNAHRGEIMACYTASSPPDAGKGNGLTLQWRIDPDGSVADATVMASTVDERTQECVLRTVRAWRFPPSNKSSDVIFPFAFGARP
jgi:TonB family protein